MNERIQELAVKAKLMAEEDINRQISYNTELKAFAEKFAELIVKECAEAALAKGRASPDTDFRTGSYVISEYLLSRYGVEE